MSSLLPYGVESSPSAALQQQARNEEQLRLFHRQLDELCNDKAQSEHREQQLLAIFAHLRSCPPQLQLDLLDLLSSLVERRPSLITGCRNLLPLTIRLLSDTIATSSGSGEAADSATTDLYAAMYMKLFWLIGVVGRESITVRDLNRLFRLLQLVVEKRAQPLLCRLLLSALSDMASGQENKAMQSSTNSALPPLAQAAQLRQSGQPALSFQSSASLFPPPSAFFEFQGPQPALVIPPMERWPFPKAYTICMWLRWDHTAQTAQQSAAHPSQMPVAAPASMFGRRPQPSPAAPQQFAYLYSLLTSKARGIEACIDKATRRLHLRSAGKSAQVESATDVVLPVQQWLLLSITHTRPKTFSRSQGTVTVHINDEVRYEGELIYPQVVEPMVSNSVGANITHIRPQTAFQGRIGSLFFFHRNLTTPQIAILARKGSDFPMNTLVTGEKAGLLRALVLTGVNALLNPLGNLLGGGGGGSGVESGRGGGYESSKTSEGAETAADKAMFGDAFRSLVLLYHPKCVENEQMVVDTSHVYTKVKSGLNATMAAGVEACAVNNVKEVLHCMIGGIRALFPIFLYIDQLSPPFSAASKGRSSASLLPLAVQTLTVMLRDNASNQREMLSCSGMAVLAHLLRLAPAHHLNEHMLTSIEELVQYTSWLVNAKASGETDEKAEPAAEQRKAAVSAGNDFLAALTDGQWVPGMSNVSLPPAAATERSLFNDLFLHVLFNLQLWARCEYAVQADVVRLVRAHVSKQAKYFRRMLHPTVILDRMRRALSYEDAIQQEMVKDIRAREAAAASGPSTASTAYTVPPSSNSSPSLPASTSFSSLHPLSLPTGPSPPPSIASPSSSSFAAAASAELSSRDSAIALRLRQLRYLRSEWYIVVKDMMLADLSRRALASDVFSLVQMCCDMTDPLQIAETLELLTQLSFAHPDQVHPLLSRCGGATLFITILQRHSQHVHVQVASFHLLSVLLRGLPADIRPEQQQQLSAIFSAIHTLLQPHPLTLVAYQALMELILALAPGALGVKNGAEYAVDFYFKAAHQPAAGDATSPAYSNQASPRSARDAGGVSGSGDGAAVSSFSSMSFARQCTIRFPAGLEVLFSLCAKDQDTRQEHDRDRATSPASTGAAALANSASLPSLLSPPLAPSHSSDSLTTSPSPSPLPPSSSFTSAGGASYSPSHITRLVPAMSMSQLLLDMDSLLSASPSQCATILNRWAAWPRPLIAQLDWHASTIDAASAASFSSRPSVESAPPPPISPTSLAAAKPKPAADAFGLFSEDAAPAASRGFFDLDTFTSGGGAESLEALNSDVDVFLQATQSSQHEDVFASLMPASSTAHTAHAAAASATSTAVAFTEPVPLLSSRILETLLYHALVHVRDGWVHWRDTLMFLRSAAQAERVEEERFRAVRRELFVGLLQRLSQSVGNDFYLSTGAVTEQLRVNMAHLIDIMEDILYFDEVRLSGASASSRLRVEEVDTRADTTLSAAPSSVSPEPSLSSRSTADDSWMVVTDEDNTDILAAANSLALSSSPPPSASASGLAASPSFSAISGSSTTSADHIRLMRGEWVLIQQLLGSIIGLQLPLTPHRHLSARPESNSFFDALKSTGDEPQPVRAGGPLRVVVRLILDCIASVVAGVAYDESGGRDETVLGGKDEQRGPPTKQIQSMFTSLVTICTRELSPSSSSSVLSPSNSTAASASVSAQKNDRAAERTWKNRYALTLLARLTAMCKSAPMPLVPALVAGCRQLVDVLQPFSLVSALNFAAGAENSDGQDRVIYVPVLVTQQGALDISPSFNFQLSSSAAEVPGMSASSSGGGGGNMSAELLAAHKRVQDSMNSGAHSRQDTNGGQSRVGLNTSTDDIFFAPPTASTPSYSFSPPTSAVTSPRSIGAMYPSSFVEPHSSASYNRVMRGCLDYVNSCMKLVSTAETRYAAEYGVLIEKQRSAVLSRLRVEREQWRDLSVELLQSAARVLQSHQYSEANRKAVVDALSREQQREMAEVWRGFQWQLFVEGSAWLPQQLIGKRRYWQLDNFEQHDSRMRRKLKQFHDGNDLRQASQTYLLELERQKQLKEAAARSAPASTTALKKRRTTSAISASGSRQLALQPADEAKADGEAAAAVAGSEAKEGEFETKGLGPGLGEVIESLEAGVLADGDEGDIDQMRAQLQQISGVLNLKKLQGAEEEEAAEQEYADDGAEAADVTDPSVVAQPTAEDDGGTQADKEAELEKEEAASAADAEWDLCVDNPDLNRPVLSTNADSYTSLNVLLVLPFTTVQGSLEVGSRYLQFVPNLNAEMTDRNGNAILDKAGDGRRVWTLPGLDAQRKRAKKTRQWELRDIVAVYRRRYQLQKTALEVFLPTGRNYFFDFGTRDERRIVLAKLLLLKPPRLNRLCSRPAVELMARSKLTQRWQKREISNFDYLMHLNTVSGRTYNDLNQYPVFPWILAYYPNRGEENPDVNIIHTINSDPSHPHTPLVFRDLRKPIGALDPKRLEQILERYHSFQELDDKMPSFLYGSHYSNAGIVMYYLLRFEPYASLHVEFQAGKFDFPDRLFYSIGQTWKTCLNSLSCYKELTPEFFYCSSVLDNVNGYDLGAKQDGDVVNDVVLPSWAADSAEFIRIHRLALESEYVSQNLHHWVDLIFGHKQKGKAAVDAHNVFFHLTYEGAVDLSTISDPVLKNAVKDQIALFGQTPLQLFKKPHPARGPPIPSKIDRLRSVNPQQYSAMLRPDYHHPHVKRMVFADRSSVVAIATVGSAKVFTVSAHFTVAVHWWNAYQQDDYVERKADGSQKRVHLPFTHALAAVDRVDKQSLLTPQHVLLSGDGKLLFEVNNWDDSLRVYAVQSNVNTEQLKLGLKDKSAAFGSLSATLMQHLRQHKGRITCVALGRDDRTLVTGSADCTLLVWQLDSEEAANKIAGLLQEGKTYVRSEPRHRLRGHEDEVVAVAVQSELDVCVSVSSRGLVLLHSLRKGWFLLRIRVPTVRELRAAVIASQAAQPVNTDDEPLSPFPGTEELVRGTGDVDRPLSADYGLDDYGGRDTLGMRRQAQSSQPASPRHSDSSAIASSAHSSAAAAAAASPSLHLPSLVRFTVEGHMIFFSRLLDASSGRYTTSQLSVCTVNGRNWRAKLVDEDVSCMALNSEGKLLALGGVRGGICIRRLHDLKVIQRFEPCASQVASIAFSVEQEYLFVSTVQGELSVLVVHC